MAATAIDLKPEPSTRDSSSLLAGLLPALRRLDGLLAGAISAMQPVAGSGMGPMLQGLFVSREQVDRLLSQEPGRGLFQLTETPAETPESGTLASSLHLLIESFGLSGFDADVILLALAPEIDLRYERIYSYLQDDVTRKRPTIDLALNLLCPAAEDKLACRTRFSPSAPLIRNRLLHVVQDPNQPEPSSLAYFFHLDDQIRRLLLGQGGLDERLAPFCRLIQPSTAWDVLSLSAEIRLALPRLAQESLAAGKPLRLYFQGAAEPEKLEAAEGLAELLGLNLLTVRIDRLPENLNPDLTWSLLTREAQLHRAVLFVSSFDDFRGADGSTRRRDLLEGIAAYGGITVLAGRAAREPRSIAPFGIVPVDFQVPDFEDRCELWEHELAKLNAQAAERDVQTLAGRFRLTPLQIARAVATAQLSSEWRQAQAKAQAEADTQTSLTLEELSSGARSQCGTELANLAPKIELHYSWNDLILPPDPKEQLREICSQAECRPIVYGKWGFDRKLSLGKGLNALFTGPPGTGKTMGAEVIAHELCLDLYRIDLSQVVSKYIGETEKNLDRIFSAAENSNSILFFDEADALFGKRSEVRDSHDRYANIEISYLLQKMEEYQGISILATNLRQNIDEAFVRRLHAIVEFPFPDEEYRRRIWENVFPKETPLGEDVRFDLFAREVRLAGGNIRNMALAASFYAAADGGVVHLSDLVHAALREHQKLARSWSPRDLLKAAAETGPDQSRIPS